MVQPIQELDIPGNLGAQVAVHLILLFQGPAQPQGLGLNEVGVLLEDANPWWYALRSSLVGPQLRHVPRVRLVLQEPVERLTGGRRRAGVGAAVPL